MTVTLKFQSSGMVPGDGRPVQMRGTSMSVGRGPANDLVLPDPDRMLSKNHFVIEDHNGNVVIVDLSTNGTFLNYSKIPLGRTPTPLNNGDVLTLGGYELIVEFGAAGANPEDLIAAPMEQDGVSHGTAGNAPDPLALLDDAGPGGDFLDDLLGGADGPTGPSQFKIPDPMDELAPPLGEDDDPLFGQPDRQDTHSDSALFHGSSMSDGFQSNAPSTGSLIPDDWDDLLAPETPPAPTPSPQSESSAPDPFAGLDEPLEPSGVEGADGNVPAPEMEQPTPKAEPEGVQETAPVPAEDAAAPALTATGDQSAAQAFLQSLDVEDLNIPDDELQTTMARMGRVMRTMITGLREVLMTRTSIKSEFRIDQTMIGAAANNPLKFSISPEQAIEALVRPRTKGYLGAESATEEALQDIKAHEVAMVTGMEAALKGVLTRLDPEVLAGQIETSGNLGSILKGKKARYWEVYEKMYADISDQAENDFHELFSREFARAYKDQLEKLK